MSYTRIHLKDLIAQIGEDETKAILSNFSCPRNLDVEYFLRQKAIEFDKQSLSVTQLIFASYQRKPVLIGYFTLANKTVELPSRMLSSKMRQRLNRFGVQNHVGGIYQIAIPLIAQLGKNFANGYEKLISGDELLKMALDQVAVGQRVFGGKFVYLECENIPALLEFYSDNGFVKFNDRPLDEDEAKRMKGKSLAQMLRFMKYNT